MNSSRRDQAAPALRLRTVLGQNGPVLRADRPTVLVATAGLLALACGWDLTSSPVNLTVAVASVVVLAVACWRYPPQRPTAAALPSPDAAASGVPVVGRGVRRVVVAVLLIGLVAAAVRPFTKDATTTAWFWVGVGVLAVATLLTIGAAWTDPTDRTDWSARLRWPAVGTAAVGLLIVVLGSPRPRIDVWVLLQGAATAVLHGRNPYRIGYPEVPAGQTSQCFTYLPGSFVLDLPGRLAGDVRIAHVVVLVGGWVALVVAGLAVRRGSGSRRIRSAADAGPAAVLASFALVLPATARVLQQSWTDSVLVGLLLVAIALVVTGHPGWAILPFAFAFASKQHMALLVPLLLLWWGWRWCLAVVAGAAVVVAPWMLAAPERVWACSVRFFIDLPATNDSVSLWRFIPGTARLPVVLAVTTAALLICWRRLPRTPAAFLLGAAFVNAAFDVANKQSYLNQWWFVAQMVLASVAVDALRAGRLAAVSTGPGASTPPAVHHSAAPPTKAPARRAVLRLAGLASAVGLLSGCSVVRMIGGPGTVTGSPSTTATPFTPRPTVIGTPVPPLEPADVALVDAAVADVVDALEALAALALRRPSLAPELAVAGAAHERQLIALAALSGTAVPKHTSVPAKPKQRSTAAANKPPASSVLASAASVEDRLVSSLRYPARTAADGGAAALIASVGASASGWHTWLAGAAADAKDAG